MTDITHDNIFTNNDTVPRLRRILDEGPALPGRAVDHELAPHVPEPPKTEMERIAEQAITPIRATGQLVLNQFRPMHDQLDEAEQMVIKAMSETEAFVHAKMRIINAAAKIQQEVRQQLKEAMEPLAALMDGK